MTTTASINSKGTKDTGITEDLAQLLHDNLGKKVVAVVELVAETRTEKRNGDEKVTLSILTCEPAATDAAEDHLRELARGFYYERQLADGQRAIDDELAPKVKDVLEQGQRHRPHPFLPVDAAADDPICDVCGVVEDGTRLHDEKAAVADPFSVPPTDEAEEADDADEATDDEDEDQPHLKSV